MVRPMFNGMRMRRYFGTVYVAGARAEYAARRSGVGGALDPHPLIVKCVRDAGLYLYMKLALSLAHHIFGAREDSRDAIEVFRDVSEAFDYVDYETLTGKLRHYGVTGRAVGCPESCLKNRVQRWMSVEL
ncbi:hypothetical protein EVAR_41835_1 [Eumeta japonica]|uniref:Uncharacterized protein n=1 Tax=Eumeta variegata TaxID=151549 RepID=A0A4C1XDA0_EUMVA|nr:hypothetical protein EVAR_41835_1 [Eumeta japonica]